MMRPELVVVVVCLRSEHPPDFVQLTLTPPGNWVVLGLQSGVRTDPCKIPPCVDSAFVSS